MPSEYQSGRNTGQYDDEPTKMLATKNDATIRALVEGIRDVDRARSYIEAELSLADAEDRDTRQDLIGLLNGKVDDLRDGDE